MTPKRLNEEEVIAAAKKAAEIVKSAGGEFMKEKVLVSKVYEAIPELQGRNLWRALSRAINQGLMQHAKYKGYYYEKLVKRFATETAMYSPAKKDDGKEHYYYPFVANWFLKGGNCLAQFRKGKEWGIPDVSIVRGSSSEELDELELITVEVKRGSASISDLSQAYRYSKLAHRCYLASDGADDLKNIKEHAERIGVGLLLINAEDPGGIEEILSPPRSEPSTISLYEHLANAFDLVTCCLCGVWFKRVWGSKKDNVPGTTCIIRNRVTGGPAVRKYACPECEGVFKLAHGTRLLR